MNVLHLRTRAEDGIPGDIETLRGEYLDHRRARGAAVNTLKAYAADLAMLEAYARRYGITLVQLVSERLLNRWIDDGLLHHGWSRRTGARRLACARTFLAWTRSEGYVDHNAAEHVRLRFRPRTVVAPEMAPLKGVIGAIGTASPLDLRDRAVLLLLLDAALRASEVSLLDLDNAADKPTYWVDVIAGRVHVRPKGGEDGEAEVVGLEPQTVDAVRAWCRVRGRLAHPECPALFVNEIGTRFSRQSLYVMVRRRGAAVGMPKLHPHLFRHRRVGEIAEKLGLDAACAQARHKQKSTTVNVYGAHAAEVQRRAIRTLCPLGEVSA